MATAVIRGLCTDPLVYSLTGLLQRSPTYIGYMKVNMNSGGIIQESAGRSKSLLGQRVLVPIQLNRRYSLLASLMNKPRLIKRVRSTDLELWLQHPGAYQYQKDPSTAESHLSLEWHT